MLATQLISFNPLALQIEYTSKIAFVWRHKFVSEKEETETTGSLNKVLLENILPAHVADHYLFSPRRQEVGLLNILPAHVAESLSILSSQTGGWFNLINN